MRSRLPKVLHPLAGRTLIDHVLTALAGVAASPIVVVTGHGADEVEAALAGRATTVRQEPQLGTADAVRVALASVPANATQLLVTMADVPLLPAELLTTLVADQAESGAAIVLLSARLADPTGYGRIVRGPDGACRAIVEDAEADPATRALDEVNAGTYCFDAAWLRANLGRVPLSPSGEHYLTDLVGLAVADGQLVRVVEAPQPETALGINDRVQLAQAEAAMRERDAIYANPEAGEAQFLRAAELEAKYAEYGGYTSEARAGELLLGLGVPTAQHEGPMSAVTRRSSMSMVMSCRTWLSP